ncbi:MAG: hypothetical protein IJ523_07145 [Succinivibrionaceae bacterium]|nr:hypothetical protein [Succinivibrionaceae bacterium]
MNIGKWIKRNGSTILTCLGAGGMIATMALTVKATLKARNACLDARIEKDRDDLTKAEIIRISIPAFIPPIAVGTGSLICIFGANALSRRQQAALASAYTALASAFEGYRGKVETLCGLGTNAAIDKAIEQENQDILDDRPPWDEVQTFYLDGCDKPAFFERTMEQVMQAEYHINRNFQLKGQVTFNEFREWLGLPPVEGGDVIGWDDYIGEVAFGYRWIDFNHRYFETDDGLMVCSIDMPFEPHSLKDGEPF